MAYKIGQIRYNGANINTDNNNFYTKMISGTDYNLTNIINDLSYYPQLTLTTNKNFQSNKSYYLNFTIASSTATSQNHTLILKNTTNQEIIDSFFVPKTEGQKKYFTFEYIFSPKNNYNTIFWDRNRSQEELNIITKNEISDKSIYGIQPDVVINTLAILTEQIGNNGSITDTSKIVKLGIQGPPLMLMCINRQQIRIGNSGIYEINNGINITSLKFVPHENDFFIVDYQY